MLFSQAAQPLADSIVTPDGHMTFMLSMSVEKMAPPAATAVLLISRSYVELKAEQRVFRGSPKDLKTYRLSGLPSASANTLQQLTHERRIHMQCRSKRRAFSSQDHYVNWQKKSGHAQPYAVRLCMA